MRDMTSAMLSCTDLLIALKVVVQDVLNRVWIDDTDASSTPNKLRLHGLAAVLQQIIMHLRTACA